MEKFDLLVCGGTFDLLHIGHKSFLKEILEYGRKVLIGLTSDSYLFSKEHAIEPYEVRHKNLNDFLDQFAKGRFEIIEINDLYGPLIDSKYDKAVIAVSEETKNGAYKINEKREDLGLQKLLIISVSMQLAQDGKPISSTRIRRGEINREGIAFIQSNWKGKVLVLPDNLRNELGKPFGTVLQSLPNEVDGRKTVCVGDITVRKFNEKGADQMLSIVDFNVQRKKEFSRLEDLGFSKTLEQIKAYNRKGGISWDLFESINKSFKNEIPKVILVKGEEDLAVIPVVLRAPLGFRVYYGQPNEGIVEVIVTEEMKENVFNLVNKFDLE